MTVRLASTSSTRSAATAARGSMMESMHSIRKPMMICIVYWIKAIISPTCIWPLSMPWAPFHMISTETPFMISIMTGIMKVMARLTNRFVLVRSRLARSKRSSSCFCVLKARITGRPVRISRITRFTRSTRDCMMRNFGMATRNKSRMTSPISTTARPMIQDMDTLVWNTWITPPMARIGA